MSATTPCTTLKLVLTYGVLWFAAYAVAPNAAERHLDAGTAAYS